MRTGDRSQHPTDQLIRELIQSGRATEPAEIERILDRMASAPFDPRAVRVPIHERGLTYGNRMILERADSLFLHLVRRVLIRGQWSIGTTPDQYLDDLRQVVRVQDINLTVYSRRGGSLAAALAPTNQVVPPDRRGPRSLPELFVVYSADRGTP
jgi:hypothetical protein